MRKILKIPIAVVLIGGAGLVALIGGAGFLFLCFDPGPEQVDLPIFIKAVSTETPKVHGVASLEIRVVQPSEGGLGAVLFDHEQHYQRKYVSFFSKDDLPRVLQIATERGIAVTYVTNKP